MMQVIRKNILFVGSALLALMLVPMQAMAAVEDSTMTKQDARSLGYNGSTWLDGGTTSLLWLLLVGLAVLALAGLFKNARRSHLD